MVRSPVVGHGQPPVPPHQNVVGVQSLEGSEQPVVDGDEARATAGLRPTRPLPGAPLARLGDVVLGGQGLALLGPRGAVPPAASAAPARRPIGPLSASSPQDPTFPGRAGPPRPGHRQRCPPATSPARPRQAPCSTTGTEPQVDLRLLRGRIRRGPRGAGALLPALKRRGLAGGRCSLSTSSPWLGRSRGSR